MTAVLLSAIAAAGDTHPAIAKAQAAAAAGHDHEIEIPTLTFQPGHVYHVECQQGGKEPDVKPNTLILWFTGRTPRDISVRHPVGAEGVALLGPWTIPTAKAGEHAASFTQYQGILVFTRVIVPWEVDPLCQTEPPGQVVRVESAPIPLAADPHKVIAERDATIRALRAEIRELRRAAVLRDITRAGAMSPEFEAKAEKRRAHMLEGERRRRERKGGSL